MAKEITQGVIGSIVSYEVKIEDGKLKLLVTADLAGSIDLVESKLPEGAAKNMEVMILEMAKQGLKAV